MIESEEIETERFLLQPITLQDVTEKYLFWLKEEDAISYIVAAEKTRDLDALKKYVHEKIIKDDVLFFAIYDKETEKHIGNIKYEPVNIKKSYAIMGILLGDKNYRGKGVATEVIKKSAHWIRDTYNINKIFLGVSSKNIAAIRAYEKTGFVLTETPYIKNTSGTISMVWES